MTIDNEMVRPAARIKEVKTYLTMQDTKSVVQVSESKRASKKSDWRVKFLQAVKNVIGIAPGDSKAKLRR
jgi:hypothetical protein